MASMGEFAREAHTVATHSRREAEKLPGGSFSNSVFVNCPYDEEYEHILQAILFCIIYLGFHPKIAKERIDSAELRISKIQEFIQTSKYSIHDLSRCQADTVGDYYRLNMPFELGIDYGCKQFYGGHRNRKKFLILEEKPFRYQAAISDLAGFDIEQHNGDFQNAVRKVRNWLVIEANAPKEPAQQILYAYADFQEWNYERLEAKGASEDDILDLPTKELMAAMTEWVNLGKPI